MAYMSQEHKAKIAVELKKVMPKDWKYSLSVRHNSTILLTISAAPVELIAHINETLLPVLERRGYPAQAHKDYVQVNEYHLDNQFSGKLLETFKKIRTALNLDNWDRSQIETDYHNVGHYVSIHIGRWDKPFQVISSTPEPTYDELKARIAALEAKEPLTSQ